MGSKPHCLSSIPMSFISFLSHTIFLRTVRTELLNFNSFVSTKSSKISISNKFRSTITLNNLHLHISLSLQFSDYINDGSSSMRFLLNEAREISTRVCQVAGFGGRRLLRKEKKGANFIPWQEPGM